MIVRFAFSLTTVLGVALLGCGSSHDPGLHGGDAGGSLDGGSLDGGGAGDGAVRSDAAPGGIAVADVPHAIASAICETLAPCVAPYRALLGGPFDDCKARFEGALADAVLPLLQMAFARGTAAYHAEQMTTCLADIRAETCREIGANRLPPSCELALEGLVAAGGACGTTLECAGLLRCDTSAGPCTGTCVPRGAAADPCSDNDHCDNGLTCQRGTCRAPSGAGEACGGGTGPECELGTLYIGADEATSRMGTCRRTDEIFVNVAGASCDLQMGRLCASGLSCTADRVGTMPLTFTCTMSVASGAPCHFGVPDPCPAEERCNAGIASGMVTGICVPKPVAAEPCVRSLFGPVCAPGLVCDASAVCREIHRVGGSCMSAMECSSGICGGGVCTSPSLCALGV